MVALVVSRLCNRALTSGLSDSWHDSNAAKAAFREAELQVVMARRDGTQAKALRGYSDVAMALELRA